MLFTEVFETLEGTQGRKDLRHTLFNMCMEHVDEGTLAFEELPAAMAHLEAYYSDLGARQVGHVAVPKPEENPAISGHSVTTALDIRPAA